MAAPYFRFMGTPLGLGSWALCVLGAAAISLAGGLSFWTGLLGALGAGFVLSWALLLSPAGGRALVSEADRERAEKDAAALRRTELERRRLVLLPFPDEAVRAARDRLAYASGKYLEDAAKNGPSAARRPRLEGALSSALAAAEDYLRLADAASASRAFGAGVPGATAEEAAGGAAKALSDAAAEIETALALGLGGLAPDARGNGASAADRAAARKELE